MSIPLRTGSAGSLTPADASIDRWSAAAWLAFRDGTTGASTASASPSPLLGGSQAGARVAYRLTGSGRTQAYGRVVTAGRRMDGAEAALGLDWQPHPSLPLRLAMERRQQVIGADARSAFAVFAVAGVSDRALPAGWRLDGYGAAGVVGAHQRDRFAEGSLRVSRPVATWGRAHISAGAGSWAATQPGVSRVDVGPTMTLRLDGVAPRLSLDWRQRVAGSAAPDSGLALTLATDF